MRVRMCMMLSTPTSTAGLPLMNLPSSLRGGCNAVRFTPWLSSPAMVLAMSTSLSRSFIFMKGHVAQPPAVLQPSPPLTPGTMPNSLSPSTMTASAATGKTISAVTLPLALGLLAKMFLTFFTIDVTMPASVPRINCRFLISPSRPSWAAAASPTFLVMKLRMSDVLPTTPLPARLASMATSNISPGTSRWAVTNASGYWFLTVSTTSAPNM
mmetsp:Transcript_12981/g.25794  ORF Transcript_12981/g.25794 Transcript_12981/m.25794 type:complete len:212 (-) Transcript_12981:1013-1648(-)